MIITKAKFTYMVPTIKIKPYDCIIQGGHRDKNLDGLLLVTLFFNIL